MIAPYESVAMDVLTQRLRAVTTERDALRVQVRTLTVERDEALRRSEDLHLAVQTFFDDWAGPENDVDAQVTWDLVQALKRYRDEL